MAIMREEELKLRNLKTCMESIGIRDIGKLNIIEVGNKGIRNASNANRKWRKLLSEEEKEEKKMEFNHLVKLLFGIVQLSL